MQTTVMRSIYYVTNCPHTKTVASLPLTCIHTEGPLVWSGVPLGEGLYNIRAFVTRMTAVVTQDDSKYQREADGPSTNTCICQTRQRGCSAFKSSQGSVHVQTRCLTIIKW